MTPEEFEKFLATNPSDKELDEVINSHKVTEAPPNKGPQTAAVQTAAVREKARRRNPPSFAEQVMPSAVERFLAASTARLYEPFAGFAEKLQLAFPGASTEARNATLQRIADERAERRRIIAELEASPAGAFGGFVGQAAPYALVRTGPWAQAGLAGGLGFLKGGADTPEGLWSEAVLSGGEGARDALITGGVMKGLELTGKGINAARGRFTKRGQDALALDAAARRLGLPAPTIGQLDPLAPAALRAHPELALQQAEALKSAMSSTRTAPLPKGGREVQTVPGGKLKAGLEEAINIRRQQARDLYGAVDDFVAKNDLGNVTPSYTVNVLGEINKKLTKSGKEPTGNNLVFNLLDNYDPDAFTWLKSAGSAKAARTAGMSMGQYHDARVAVGRSLNALERVQQANMTDDQIAAKRLLVKLKTALDNDVERWAKQHAGNEEALALYNTAKEFYSKTAAEAVNNPLARKIVSKTRGFDAPERMYEALINPANRTLADRLLPTASPETRDMLRVLQDLPDVGTTVARGSVPQGLAEQELGALARGAVGHPGLALMELAPGLRALSTKTPAKKWYFGAPPENRLLGPLGQYPAEDLETWVQGRTFLGQDR